MKRKLTLLLVLALVAVMLVGCGKTGNPQDPGTNTSETAKLVDDLTQTLDDLPKTQSNQTDVTDADILIP